MTQQIGYSLLYDTHYDFGNVLLNFLGDRLSVDRRTVYYARLCQLLFSYCFPNVEIGEADKIYVSKLNKRAFKYLVSRDGKKLNIPNLRIPTQAKKLLIAKLPTVYGLENVQGPMLQGIARTFLSLTQAP